MNKKYDFRVFESVVTENGNSRGDRSKATGRSRYRHSQGDRSNIVILRVIVLRAVVLRVIVLQ